MGRAISFGFSKFFENIGPLLILALVAVGAQIVLSLLGQFVFTGVVSQLMLNVLSFVVSSVLAIALIRACLDIVDGRSPDLNRAFSLDNVGQYILASIIFGIAVGVGLVLCILPGLAVLLLFGLFGYFIIDRGLDGIDGLKASFDVAKRNIGPLIVLYLAAIAIAIIGLALCCVGLIPASAIIGIATAHAYRQLTGGYIAG
ncbi:MAG: hypothetical protein S0880_08150 [Actinomycetota bacterium]|nr:hypothetical protein [Actinomycetota bacterium]